MYIYNIYIYILYIYIYVIYTSHMYIPVKQQQIPTIQDSWPVTLVGSSSRTGALSTKNDYPCLGPFGLPLVAISHRKLSIDDGLSMAISWWYPIIWRYIFQIANQHHCDTTQIFWLLPTQQGLSPDKNPKKSPMTLEVCSLSLLLLCSYVAWTQHKKQRDLQLELAKQRREAPLVTVRWTMGLW